MKRKQRPNTTASRTSHTSENSKDKPRLPCVTSPYRFMAAGSAPAPTPAELALAFDNFAAVLQAHTTAHSDGRLVCTHSGAIQLSEAVCQVSSVLAAAVSADYKNSPPIDLDLMAVRESAGPIVMLSFEQFHNNRPRFEGGDIITGEQLAKFEAALRILRLRAETVGKPESSQITLREESESAAPDDSGVKSKEPAATSPPNPPRTYTTDALREMTGLKNTALNKYARLAGVSVPARGKRNHRYDVAEVRSILLAIISDSSEKSTLRLCQDALKSLTNPTQIN